MLKVACESCQAPYQIDERRVPPSGLKMRCPKCGHSFIVSAPTASAPAAAAPQAPAPPAAAAPAAPPRPTAQMVAPPLPPRPSGNLPRVAGPPVPPRPAPSRTPTATGLSPADPAAPLKKTMMGVAPPSAPPAVESALMDLDLTSDFPPALGFLDDADLPVVPADLPSPKAAAPPPPKAAPPPAPAAPKAPPLAASRAPARPRPPSFGDVDADLPMPAVGLPVAKPNKPAEPFEVDLPAPRADLPVKASGAADLPAFAGAQAAVGLPVVATGLPVVSAQLPTVAANLPVPAQALPVAAQVLPAPARRRSFGELDLPVVTDSLPQVLDSLPHVAESLPQVAESLPQVAESLPQVLDALPHVADVLPSSTPLEQHLPSLHPAFDASLGAFGEIDLPREGEPAGSPPPARKRADSSDFGDLDSLAPAQDRSDSSNFGDLDAPPAGARSDSSDFGGLELGEAPPAEPRARVRESPAAARAPSGASDGGTSYGEVELGETGDVGAPEESFGVEAPMPTAARSPSRSDSRPEGGNSSAAELSLPSRAPVSRERPAAAVRAKPSKARLAAIGVGVVALLGGLALQVTPYGAFGYLVATDYLRAGEYARAASSAVRETESAFGTDTYDAAKAAVERVFAAHLRMPRAKSLTAYAAIVDDEAAIRFGADVARASRAKLLVSELSPATPVPYADVALAAQAGEAGHFDVASGALDAASRHYSGDPIDTDILFLRADLALGSGDLATARDAFQRALDRTKSARAHFGLARVLDLAGDTEGAKREIDATLALVPLHPGALVLRARRQSATVDPAHAAADLALVIDGAAHEKASPSDLSNAYAAHAWVALEGGATAEARDAFAQAVKLDPSSVAALDGEGRLFMADGRYTEALARFDTALASSQSFPQAIADDADAKLALERLADAKQQLVAARDRFPKSVPILLTLGRVEQRLGNDDAAEADLRATIAAVDPTRADAVLPYVVLAKLQSSRGRLADAHATLDAAATKLPPSSQLDRAFGEVAELQGDYDGAVARFRAAVVKDPKDLTARFRLAVVLRRQRKYDAAVAVLDRVSAVDADFPGLLLERGMLFEDTGDVQKAIELFKSALARAPDDPDLQLRVGAAYVAIGRAEDALPMLKKTLEKRPGSAEAHHYMGRALLIKGGSYMNDALTYLKRAVELDPNRAEYHIYLARAANEMAPAQLELARDEVDRALALDKAEGDAYWQRGVLERMEGAIDDAMKDEAHALQLRPTRYEAYATLAQCHEDRNETPQAIAAWGRAIQGDNGATGADGEMLHPFWHYRYGKLLYDKGDRASALPHLAGASAAAEKLETRPAWLAPLEFAAAEALRVGGRRVDAIEHYHRFLDLAPISSPDRADAQAALVQLGAPPTR